MPKKHSDAPFVRWSDDATSDDVGRAIGNLFRAVPSAEPMPEAVIESTRRKLIRHRTRRKSLALLPRVAVLVSVLAGGASEALAEWARPRWWSTRAELLVPASRRGEAIETPKAARPAIPTPSTLPVPAAPAGELDEVSPSPEVAPSLRKSERPLAAPIVPPASRTELALESESLGQALVALRQEHDGAAALSLLDDHETRFPRGALALEARIARVEALLLLKRRKEAATWLEKLPLDGTAPRSELQLLRAELRADQDCDAAIADFDKVLLREPPARLGERALYGRAACRLRKGDRAGADADLRTYLTRYPAGRFAEQVRVRLASP